MPLDPTLQQLAMADEPPGFPPGKTNPSQFLFPMREPPSEKGGAAPNLIGAIRRAAEMIKTQQKGISTVHIGDIKALLQASGIKPEHIDAAILAESRAGRATLAKSSTTRMTDAQKQGGLKLDDDHYHTVTFK